MNLSGQALLRYGNMGARAIDISLTHCRDYALAQAVILIGE